MQSSSADWVSSRPEPMQPVNCNGAYAAIAGKTPIAGGCYDRVPRACRLAQEIASAFFAIPVPEIERPGRTTARTCEARHVAMYLAHVAFQIPLSAMAQGFGRDRTTIAYAIRRIEDRRDDTDFDAAIERLECLAHAVRTALEGRTDDSEGGRA